jgi:hypothetical protein
MKTKIRFSRKTKFGVGKLGVAMRETLINNFFNNIKGES